jgi:hypothetical protein
MVHKGSEPQEGQKIDREIFERLRRVIGFWSNFGKSIAEMIARTNITNRKVKASLFQLLQD